MATASCPSCSRVHRRKTPKIIAASAIYFARASEARSRSREAGSRVELLGSCCGAEARSQILTAHKLTPSALQPLGRPQGMKVPGSVKLARDCRSCRVPAEARTAWECTSQLNPHGILNRREEDVVFRTTEHSGEGSCSSKHGRKYESVSLSRTGAPRFICWAA